MRKIYRHISFFLSLIFFLPLFADVRGVLFNQYGGNVSDADISLTYSGESTVLEQASTDDEGYFTLTLDQPIYQNIHLFPSYPNPSHGSAVLTYYSPEELNIKLTVFNIRGEKLSERSWMQSKGGDQFVWQAINNRGERLSAGIYIIRLEGNASSSSIKVLLIDHSQPAVNPGDANNLITQYTGGKRYDLHISKDGTDLTVIENIILIPGQVNDFYINEPVDLPFVCENGFLKVLRNGTYEPIFLKGVNLGVAVPGTQPGELAASREQYTRWIREIADAGLNYLRTYTLHYPRFYEELASYNNAHPENPIYLLQGVWLDEEYEDDLITSQSEKFNEDIEEIVDCLHGNRVISHRFGRAYGTFETDISPWLFGYIIGREIHPYEVIQLEVLYPDSTSYSGSSFSIESDFPIDIWLTGRLDHLVSYERETYQTERPVSVSSWPTLDPLQHPTEDPERTEEDIASLDMANIEAVNAPAGFFMSYHAYPYYPDFISEDPGYQTFSDSVGPNSYLGYLYDLKDHYSHIPLLIAEYGVPSSWGNAHFAFSGMHHGGFSEYEQGIHNVRMLQNIHTSGCAGGLVFSWIDEWFKNAWITEPFGTDATRRHFWHNVTSPEQNYGMIGFKKNDQVFSLVSENNAMYRIHNIKVTSDQAYFYAQIELSDTLMSNDTVWVSFDTYRSDLGESLLPNDQHVSNRAEFVLAANKSDLSPMYVTQAYDLFGIWHHTSASEQLYHSIATDSGKWNPIRWKTNFYEWSYQEIGLLRTAYGNDVHSSIDGVRIQDNIINLRIPWSLLQFTDPSRKEVMDDYRNTVEREVSISDGVSLTVNLGNAVLTSDRYLWDNWDIPSDLIDYEKASYEVFVDGIRDIPSVPY